MQLMHFSLSLPFFSRAKSGKRTGAKIRSKRGRCMHWKRFDVDLCTGQLLWGFKPLVLSRCLMRCNKNQSTLSLFANCSSNFAKTRERIDDAILLLYIIAWENQNIFQNKPPSHLKKHLNRIF